MFSFLFFNTRRFVCAFSHFFHTFASLGFHPFFSFKTFFKLALKMPEGLFHSITLIDVHSIEQLTQHSIIHKLEKDSVE